MVDGPRATILAIILSIAGLSVAYYTARQTAVTAVATAELSTSEKLQARPWVSFEDVSVWATHDYIVVHATLVNTGRVPVSVSSAEFGIDEKPCVFTKAFDVNGLILDPGRGLKMTMWPARRRRVGLVKKVDCAQTDPSKFTFSATYKVYQTEKPFEHTVNIRHLAWSIAKGR